MMMVEITRKADGKGDSFRHCHVRGLKITESAIIDPILRSTLCVEKIKEFRGKRRRFSECGNHLRKMAVFERVFVIPSLKVYFEVQTNLGTKLSCSIIQQVYRSRGNLDKSTV